MRYNRAFILQEVGRWDDAPADLDVAAELVPDDEDIRAARRECLARVPAAT
ncbi:hypothetical protein [Embleya sp. NPDC020886]|uniref:hypothetical protein n=1 Tax=Embleya sp. NPDC020886 TaxID=3363980 RepID=UPI0037888456